VADPIKFYWVDLETTGLHPAEDAILEIAVAEAPFRDPFNLTHIYHAVLALPPDIELSPFIVDMHTKNGLLEECRKSTTTLFDVHTALAPLIPSVTDDIESRPTLAGSCIDFDHAFLKAHLPGISERFHYRRMDVSAVKLLARALGMPKIPKGEAHRAKADIEESAVHGRLCTEWWENRKTEDHVTALAARDDKCGFCGGIVDPADDDDFDRHMNGSCT
jgi:oligoribonuclease